MKSRLDALMNTLHAMDDNPGWLSGDKKLIAQLCRCVSEMHEELKAIKKAAYKAANDASCLANGIIPD